MCLLDTISSSNANFQPYLLGNWKSCEKKTYMLPKMFFISEIVRWEFTPLTLCILVSSADNLCKQVGARSGPTQCRGWSGSKLFDTWWYSRKNFSKTLILNKEQQMTKKHEKLFGRQRVKVEDWQLVNKKAAADLKLGLKWSLETTKVQ